MLLVVLAGIVVTVAVVVVVGCTVVVLDTDVVLPGVTSIAVSQFPSPLSKPSEKVLTLTSSINHPDGLPIVLELSVATQNLKSTLCPDRELRLSLLSK